MMIWSNICVDKHEFMRVLQIPSLLLKYLADC